MTTRGFPVLYYGTEIALEGGNDPDNRRSMPWEVVDQGHPLQDHIRALSALRQTHSALRRGDLQTLVEDDSLLIYSRTAGVDREVVAFNNGDEPVTLTFDAQALPNGTTLRPVLPSGGVLTVDGRPAAEGSSTANQAGQSLKVQGGAITLTLPPRSFQVYVTLAKGACLPAAWWTGTLLLLAAAGRGGAFLLWRKRRLMGGVR